MDNILWQATISFDLVHSSYKWIPAYCYVGNTAQQCRLGLFQDSDLFCRRPCRLKINIRRCLLHFRKSLVCANKLECARNRLQFHTVLQKLKSFLSMQVYAWTVFQLSLRDLVIEVFLSVPNRTDGPTRKQRENRRQLSSQTCITSSQWSTPTSFQQKMITFHQIQRILVPVFCGMSLRTMRQESKWLSKVEVPQWDMFHGHTELLWIGCFDRINLDPQIQIRHIDTKHQLADMLTKGNFTTWWVEQSLAALRISAW